MGTNQGTVLVQVPCPPLPSKLSDAQDRGSFALPSSGYLSSYSSVINTSLAYQMKLSFF